MIIEQKAGKTISEIFCQDGEIQFREAEIETTKEVSRKKNTVIACGGGMVLNKINIDRLRNECIIVYLTASPQIILRRTSGDKNKRPLLMDTEQMPRIRELLRYRKPFYERAADIKVNTSRLKVNSVAREIIGKLKENNIRVNYYGTDSTNKFISLLNKGVDFTLTNNVNEFIEVAKELGVKQVRPKY